MSNALNLKLFEFATAPTAFMWDLTNGGGNELVRLVYNGDLVLPWTEDKLEVQLNQLCALLPGLRRFGFINTTFLERLPPGNPDEWELPPGDSSAWTELHDSYQGVPEKKIRLRAIRELQLAQDFVELPTADGVYETLKALFNNGFAPYFGLKAPDRRQFISLAVAKASMLPGAKLFDGEVIAALMLARVHIHAESNYSVALRHAPDASDWKVRAELRPYENWREYMLEMRRLPEPESEPVVPVTKPF